MATRLRTWADWAALDGDEALSDAERHLVDCCRAGQPCILGDGTRPDGPSPERSVRADLLRYLILGGCERYPTDELGVQLAGAHVKGPLDLSFASARGQTDLRRCKFEKEIVAFQSRLEALYLDGSAFPGLNAAGGEVTGDVFLRQVNADGEVSLSGAKISGQLSCREAKFRNAGGKALDVQVAEIASGVFLGEFTADGEVRLTGAKIGGQLDCEKTKFRNARGDALLAESAEIAGSVFLRGTEADGEVRLSGAKIGGQLVCSEATIRNVGGDAFTAQRLRVVEGLFWLNVNTEEGSLNFNSAHVGDLVDDLESWPDRERVYLDGFTYDRISGTFLDAPRRLAWLRRGSRWNGAFFPQPYTQLAKVLREMGHDRTARAVLIERSRQIRQQVRKDAYVEPDGTWGVAFRSIWADLVNAWRITWGSVLWAFTGFGYAPWRSLGGLVGLFVIAVFFSDLAWQEGSFAPNDGAVLVSQGWQDFADRPGNPAADWSADGAPGMDWDSFNRYGYALDLVVPILDLGQTDAWAPSKDRSFWGWGLWLGRWVLSSLGWIVTALGAAAVTGIIRRD
ncbi:MAG: hypothetical protein AAGG56_01555 [Pseudomonadota bacterium]